MRRRPIPKKLFPLLLSFILIAATFGTARATYAEGQNTDNDVAFIYTEDATGDTKNVVTVLNGDNIKISDASLKYEINGTDSSAQSTKISGNAALFKVTVKENETIELKSLTYKTESGNSTVKVTLKNDGVSLSLQNSSKESSAEGSAGSESGQSSNVISIDESSIVNGNEIESSLHNQENDNQTSTYSLNSSKHNLVIALDPGHGGWDPGAGAFGLREKDLTLKIAQYCKQALEQYPGVTVYMTRDGDYSPSGTQNTGTDLRARVNNSISNGADAIVSIHINSSGPSATGSEVWYPNNSTWANEETHGKGKELAEAIEDKLVSLGLNRRGVFTRDYPADDGDSEAYYADGSTADYYGILRYARRQNIPAIIVEHAFVTNSTDAQKLASDSWLKSMGEADAEGIAQAYGLRKNGQWHQSGSQWWYSIDGKCQYGWIYVAGSWYYADETGYIVNGLRTINSSLYYFDETGAMTKGWKNLNSSWYYFGYDGTSKRGWQKVNGTWYWFDDNGIMATGWKRISNSWYYFQNSGAMKTGWLNLDGNWYYLEPSGTMVENTWKFISDSWYYFDGTGAMQTGWYFADNNWYYSSTSGAMQTGWLKINESWYYLESSGVMAKSKWEFLGNYWYHFADSGLMQTGWYTVDDNWYYSTESGAMKVGWLDLAGTWYYLKSSGAMQTGWAAIDGSWYLFGNSGAMVQNGYGWDGKSYSTFDANGHWMGYAADGWNKINENWYWLNNGGKPTKGWISLGNTWYYLQDNGSMAIGWFTDGGHSYFANENGAMLTGWQYINGKYEYFNELGEWDASKTQSLQSITTDDRTDYTKQMVAAFKTSNRRYPADSLSMGGVESVEKFCQIIQQEANDESIDPRLLFCQIMKETGWLQFGGQVSIDQFNFGGLGAVDGGAKGASFSSVREGIRAQAQHLKAYASKNASAETLSHGCVDPRFDLVSKGSAPYIQWLGIKENPAGAGWATGRYYGISIVEMIRQYF